MPIRQPEGTAVEGAVVVDFLQLWAMAEWRLSRVVAFTFTLRWVPYVSDLVVNGTLDAGNPAIGVGLRRDLSELQNAFAVIPGFVFSWDRANIRLGVGYSSFFVDGFYLVIPRRRAQQRLPQVSSPSSSASWLQSASGPPGACASLRAMKRTVSAWLMMLVLSACASSKSSTTMARRSARASTSKRCGRPAVQVVQEFQKAYGIPPDSAS